MQAPRLRAREERSSGTPGGRGDETRQPLGSMQSQGVPCGTRDMEFALQLPQFHPLNGIGPR